MTTTAGPRPTADETARFWEQVDQTTTPDGCWTWTGSMQENGYGAFRIACATNAHRAGYEIQVGPIPDGMVLDHLCRNRACVRASHLEPVTHRENILRGDTGPGANAKKTHCQNGHELAGDNLYVQVVKGRERRTCRTCHKAYMDRYYQEYMKKGTTKTGKRRPGTGPKGPRKAA